MEELSKENQVQGRYLMVEQRRRKQRKRNIIILATIAMILCVSLLLIYLLPQKSVYRALCDDGYDGTQEQLIASLVGEEIAPQGDSAYTMAVKNGYKKSEADWIKTITGAEEFDKPIKQLVKTDLKAV